jgi:hypothetical protein
MERLSCAHGVDPFAGDRTGVQDRELRSIVLEALPFLLLQNLSSPEIDWTPTPSNPAIAARRIATVAASGKGREKCLRLK